MITLQKIESDEQIPPQYKKTPKEKVTFKTLDLNKDLEMNDGQVIADNDELDSVQHFDMSIIDDVD